MAATNPSASTSQEYIVRVPKNSKKRFHVMRFNGALNIDFSKWNHVKMERENNLKEFKSGIDEDMPKFGAGSEFGKDAREEARRKKYGIIAKKYRPEDQPWIIKIGGKTGKKFKGIREGGVGENASYYVFTQATDGAFEAFPIEEWYNFSPIQRYNALSAEEAEEAFGRRNQVLNYFSIMLKKRLKNEDDDGNEEEKEGKGFRKMKEFKISELDDWDEKSSSDEDDDDEGEDKKKDDDDSTNKKKKKKKVAKKKKSKKDTDDEAMEDSDDGDEEGREVDYISDSASSDEEVSKSEMTLIGVAEEDALRNLLTSDEEEDEEEEKKEDKDATDAVDKAEEEEPKKKKKSKKDKVIESDAMLSSSTSSESSQSENELDSALFLQRKKKGKKNEKRSVELIDSRSNTPTKGMDSQSMKRKLEDSPSGDGSGNKKSRLDNSSTVSSFGSGNSSPGDTGITEEAVRKYLMRKPMTTTELLQKFKSKKTGLPTEQLVTVLAQILKRINPTKQTIKGKLYLLLKL